MHVLEALTLAIRKWGDRAYAAERDGLCEVGVVDPGMHQFSFRQTHVVKGRGETWGGAFESAAAEQYKQEPRKTGR